MSGICLRRTALEHARALAVGEYTSVALTRAYLERIRERQEAVGAFLALNTEAALRAAQQADARRAQGAPRSALDGIPFAVKDNFCTAGLRTTCASRMLRDFIPTYHATVVQRLLDAGCILLGKTNLDEFAMGSTTQHAAFGATRHPLDPDYVPGGSSGGSAAAVADFQTPFALGSDTGGSVRQPAAFCGILGMKPTYGLLSRYGMISHASSLDCVGLLARNAADCEAILEILAGRDENDLTSLSLPSDYNDRFCRTEEKPLRVAVVRELLSDAHVCDEVRGSVEGALDVLRCNGARISEVSLPDPMLALATYCVISSAEAASNLSRYDGVRYGHRAEGAECLSSLYAQSRAEGFGTEVKRRVLFGTYLLSEEKRALYYEPALLAREQIRSALLSILGEFDVILSPTTPSGAFLRKATRTQEERRRADLCVVYASLAGLPSISVPFGTDRNGMPLGVQLTAAPLQEARLLQVAAQLEEVNSNALTV